MELELSTPALLFSAITLLMLAYTNRFLAMANLIRGLNERYREHPDDMQLLGQLHNLRKRMIMIKYMQIFGVISFLICVVCMFLIYRKFDTAANVTFMMSMLALLISLGISLWEINLSTKALSIELSGMEEVLKKAKGGALGLRFKDSKHPSSEE
ncbi:DUF2721 domain-containing protein [Echinicola strongylocentroti]|uniref:DUF2721 domain-containing protein n=1 Tax=Echinicola strongylocentroti TaxID=1795355 RepID=A0A2Z4IGE1_9BACT|nr:DUF2721 domain-containing protein [Echinicola strongylocentroti]AWW29740.1 DUF2721 domain-containing protein [Echinicola strongylocentroti]